MCSDPFAELVRKPRWKARLGRWRRTVLRPLRRTRIQPRRPGPPNLLLVGVDTLRADRLGFGGHDQPTSPNLDRFAARGTVFCDVTAPAPWTLPSFAGALTGLMPGLHGGYLSGRVRNMDTQPPGRLHADTVSLATRLRQEGYRCAAFYSNPFFAFGLAESFDEHHYHNLPAEDLASIALDWIRRHADGPFFCFLLLNDPHEPTTPTGADLAPFLPALKQQGLSVTDDLLRGYVRWGKTPGVDLGRIDDDTDPLCRTAVAVKLAIYDATIRQVDRTIGELYKQLQTWHLADRTLCSVFSDHGEEFLDHGAWSRQWRHDPRGIAGIGHGHTHFQELLHVPWLAWGPSVPSGIRRRDPVSLLDLAPTLLHWLGLAPLDLAPIRAKIAAAAPELNDLPGDVLLGQSVAVEEDGGGRTEHGGNGSVQTGDPTLDGPGQERLILAEAMAYGPDLVALRRGRWKLIAHRDGRVLALFDLRDDRRETTDLQEQKPEVVADLLGVLEIWRASGLGAGDDNSTGERPDASSGGSADPSASWDDLDQTVRQRLKDLGYSE